jgi:hypothetical protein
VIRNTPSTANMDNFREDMLKKMCGLLDSGEGKRGIDARDIYGNDYELKTGTIGSFATTRDFGFNTLEKWSVRHWICGHGYVDQDRNLVLTEIYYISPKQMRPWFERMEEVLLEKKKVIEISYRLYSESKYATPEGLKHLKWIHRRGGQLNGPKLSLSVVKKMGTLLGYPYDKHLRELVPRYIEPIPYYSVKKDRVSNLEAFFDDRDIQTKSV